MRRDVYRCLGAALLLTALTAGAADAPLAGSWQAVLQEQIARARKERPEAFARVDSAVSRVGLLDARKRGTLASVSPLFRELGPDALWPMVERLAFPSEQAKGMEQNSARLALAVGLMEALGELRDARLVPLWKDLLETGADTRAPVLRAAAGALARMETLEAAQMLIAVSRQGGPRGEAAQEKLGECRLLVAARALADALAARPGPEEARRLARSLGDAGSAWAWKTSGASARSEEGAVRRVAAEALVRAYSHYTGDVRQALSNAVLRVDAPETASLIDEARLHADASGLAALDALAERLRHNPLR
ncbi:hypothetical protein [Pyxidicoccus caerfyrddinensis]|uniref:hypothetical protein n=1 Tax=Pyxidicoccus caerfyrddinensis TaxID=2709663 RepID=UPI0013DBE22D|nr:hypothetical protein [Pyxidicoccus caerfyrddinensis]